MLPFSLSESTLIVCWILYLAADVLSQTTPEESRQPDRYRTCDASNYCIPIGRCTPLRDGWNRRGVGITCGYGVGFYRMVCCPRGPGGGIPVRQTRHPVRTTTTPVPTPATGNVEECGLSQGIDWFEEHAADDADEATWPWMVSIRRQERTGLFVPRCSGFLIDRTHVLSAAHCFEESNNRTYIAIIGNDNQNLGKKYRISDVKQHEEYRSGMFYNDIALLTLAREVNVSNFVPICLPDDRIAAMDLTGWGATELGWGSETHGGVMSINLKQLDDVPIVSNEECYQILNRTMHRLFHKYFPRGITRDMICAGQTESSRDACGGDSGGPVMILYRKRWFAVGLISFGYTCGLPGVPGGSTRISSYVDWIRENTGNGTRSEDYESDTTPSTLSTQYYTIPPNIIQPR